MNAATPFPLVTDVPPVVLDPLRFPLHGSRLIEASAGTGKTFTIAALYLRLVLGHGGDAAFARALTPPEILVVTFTDAATKELRDRIRARLAQAAAYFLAGVAAPRDDASAPEDDAGASFDFDAWLESDQDADADLPPGMDFDAYDDFPADARLARAVDPVRAGGPPVAGDALLEALRDDYPPGTWQGCARKLQLAAEWMDEAAVSTIHGWCHRMLREHAFDSDSLFTQTLETDQSEMLAEVVRDYWRTFLYPLDAGDVDAVLQWWKTPDELCRQLRNLLGHGALLGAGVAPAQALRQARDATADALAALKAPWAAWIDELRTLFDAAVAAKQVDARKMQRRYYEGWLASLRTWRDTTEQVAPDLSDTAW
ncbi:MAG: UvrD-helicase domain-containing protein, partial [Janthinobacterium lividum]